MWTFAESCQSSHDFHQKEGGLSPVRLKCWSGLERSHADPIHLTVYEADCLLFSFSAWSSGKKPAYTHICYPYIMGVYNMGRVLWFMEEVK